MNMYKLVILIAFIFVIAFEASAEGIYNILQMKMPFHENSTKPIEYTEVPFFLKIKGNLINKPLSKYLMSKDENIQESDMFLYDLWISISNSKLENIKKSIVSSSDNLEGQLKYMSTFVSLDDELIAKYFVGNSILYVLKPAKLELCVVIPIRKEKNEYIYDSDADLDMLSQALSFIHNEKVSIHKDDFEYYVEIPFLKKFSDANKCFLAFNGKSSSNLGAEKNITDLSNKLKSEASWIDQIFSDTFKIDNHDFRQHFSEDSLDIIDKSMKSKWGKRNGNVETFSQIFTSKKLRFIAENDNVAYLFLYRTETDMSPKILRLKKDASSWKIFALNTTGPISRFLLDKKVQEKFNVAITHGN